MTLGQGFEAPQEHEQQPTRQRLDSLRASLDTKNVDTITPQELSDILEADLAKVPLDIQERYGLQIVSDSMGYPQIKTSDPNFKIFDRAWQFTFSSTGLAFMPTAEKGYQISLRETLYGYPQDFSLMESDLSNLGAVIENLENLMQERRDGFDNRAKDWVEKNDTWVS